MNELLMQDSEKFWDFCYQYRGEKLNTDPEVKNGKEFLGKEAMENGLIDGIGGYQSVLMKKYPNEKIEFIRSSYELESLLYMLRIASRIGKIYQKSNLKNKVSEVSFYSSYFQKS